MIRTAVATYLMVLAVVGPVACCCSPARLTALLLAPAEATAAAPCCRPTATQDEDRPAPARPDCPCRHGTVCQIASLPALPRGAAEGPADPAPATWLLDADILPAPALGGAASGRRPPPRPPFLSPRDRLRLRHLLRC